MLKNMLQRSDSIDIALLLPLGRMGPDAVDCLPFLFDAFERERDPKILTAICHAILGVLPFMDPDDMARGTLDRLPKVAIGHGDAEHVELAIVLDMEIQGIFQVSNIQTDVAELTAWVDSLAPRQHYDHARAQAAVRWLGRAGSAGAPALGALHARLLELPPKPNGRRLVAPFAEAILLIDPSSTEAIDAHVFLVVHGDAYQQQTSVVALRHLGDRAHTATLWVAGLLAWVAEDPDTVKQIRYEAVVTLGVIGPAAKDAIPTLEKLTEHDDPQIAERAKAALRQVRDT